MYRVLAVNGATQLAIFMLVVFVALFAWIALSFTSAIAGFVSVMAGGGRRLLDPGQLPASRTALLMPTYNEPPARIMAGLEAMDEALRKLHASVYFDIFILSDTTSPEAGSRKRKRSSNCVSGPTGRNGSSTATVPGTPRARRATSPSGSAGSAAPIPSS